MDLETSIDAVPARVKERARAFHVDGYDDSFVVQGSRTNHQVFGATTDPIDSHQFLITPVASIQSSVPLDYVHLAVLGLVCFIVGVNVALWFCRRPGAPNVDVPSKVIKESHNDQSNINIPSSNKVAPLINTCVGLPRHDHQITLMPDESDDPPHLIPDDEHHHNVHRKQEQEQQQHEQQLRLVQVVDPPVTSNGVLSTTSTTCSSAFGISSSALIERPETYEESVHSLMHFAQLTKQNSRVMGLDVDDNVILQTASKMYLHKDKTKAGRSREARLYYFMHNQNEMNRHQTERHHVENQDSRREEPDWRKKLIERRNAAFDALSKSVAQTCAAIFLSSLVVPLYLKFKAWGDLGYVEMVCYGAGTSIDSLARSKEDVVIESNNKTTWSDWFWYSDRSVWAWPSFNNIANFGFGETLSCIAGALGHGAYYFLALFILSGCLWLVTKLSFPQFVQQAIQWGMLVGWLMANEWVPRPPCRELTLLAVILYLLGSIPIQLQYTKIKGSLERDKGVPHADYFNKLCDWFDQATFYIRFVPLGFGGVYTAVVVYAELGEWLQYLA